MLVFGVQHYVCDVWFANVIVRPQLMAFLSDYIRMCHLQSPVIMTSWPVPHHHQPVDDLQGDRLCDWNDLLSSIETQDDWPKD